MEAIILTKEQYDAIVFQLEEITKKLNKALAAKQETFIDKTDAMLGTIQRVLIEKVSDKDPDLLVGTADNTRYVTFIGDASWVGRFAEIEITEIKTVNQFK